MDGITNNRALVLYLITFGSELEIKTFLTVLKKNSEISYSLRLKSFSENAIFKISWNIGDFKLKLIYMHYYAILRRFSKFKMRTEKVLGYWEYVKLSPEIVCN